MSAVHFAAIVSQLIILWLVLMNRIQARAIKRYEAEHDRLIDILERME